MTAKILSLTKIESLFESNDFFLKKIYKTGKLCKFFEIENKRSCSTFFVRVPHMYAVNIKTQNYNHIDIVKTDEHIFSHHSTFLKKIKPGSCTAVISLSKSHLFVQFATTLEAYKLKVIVDISEEDEVDVGEKKDKSKYDEVEEDDDENIESKINKIIENAEIDYAEEDEEEGITEEIQKDVPDTLQELYDTPEPHSEPVEIIFEDDSPVTQKSDSVSHINEVLSIGVYVMYDLTQIFDRIKILQNEVQISQEELDGLMESYRKEKFMYIKNNTSQTFNTLQQQITTYEKKYKSIKIASKKLSELYVKAKETQNEIGQSRISAELCRLRNEDNKIHNIIVTKIDNFYKVIERLIEMSGEEENISYA
ncbi:MAG TPA: hypothetical protein VLE02_01650 [Nitrosarchaeum sp.]|nr:hypothetical protein [Nitrosarchaeum sp.]